jgi:hypothetical protein
MGQYIIELRLKETGHMVRQHGPFSKEEADTKAAGAPQYIRDLYTVHVLPAPPTMIRESCPHCTAKMTNIGNANTGGRHDNRGGKASPLGTPSL